MIEQRRWLLPRRALAVGTALATVYLVFITGQQAVQAYQYNQQVADARAEIVQLRSRNLQLQAELSQGRSDEEIERIAREELSLVKPGDHPIALAWPDGIPAEKTTTPSLPEPNWKGWLRLFVDVDTPSQGP